MKNSITQIKEQNLEQLYKELADSQKGLREARFKIANMELKDIASKKRTRKKIAQILTVIREKEEEKLVGENVSEA